MGVTFTFPSSTMMLFASEDTTLHRQMTDTEIALFSSLSAIGFLLDIIGRKFCATLFSMTHVIAWTMLIASNRVEALFSAVFLSGIGGAAFLVVPMYVSEFCQESIRGGMTSFAMIFYAVGMIVSYAIGGYMSYYPMLYVCLSIAVVGIALLCILRESPLYLMQKGREKEAAKSIAFYRAVPVESKVVYQEMDAIRRALNAGDLASPGTAEEEHKLKPEEKPKKMSPLQFIKKSYPTRRALFVALTLMTASLFQGIMVIQVYADRLFSEAIPTMSATVSSILFSVISVLAGFLAAYLTDVAGRRPLMIYSSIDGVCCVLLGSQIHMHWGPHSVTAVLIYAFCVVNTLGAGTIPFILSAELFLPEIKSLMSMVVIEWVWLCGFVILFIFNPLVKAVGLGQVFYIFSIFYFGTAAFTFFFLPETKGLPVDAIQTLFSRKRSKVPTHA